MRKSNFFQLPLPLWKNGDAQLARFKKKSRARDMKSRFCIYSGRVANTRDHVPPKCLLEKPYPRNLITVPASSCANGSFAKDEQYFLTVLAHVGFTENLMAKVDSHGVVDRTLKRSSGLEDRITRSLKPDDGGRVWLMPERDRMHRIICKIACGLYYSRYRRFRPLKNFSPVGL